MKFIILGFANKDTEAGVLPSSEDFVKMGKFQEELVKAGVLVGGEGLQPSSKGARITFGKDGKTSIKNGPFTESKELVAGFSVLELPSLAAAKELCEEYAAILGDNEVDIREVDEANA